MGGFFLLFRVFPEECYTLIAANKLCNTKEISLLLIKTGICKIDICISFSTHTIHRMLEFHYSIFVFLFLTVLKKIRTNSFEVGFVVVVKCFPEIQT